MIQIKFENPNPNPNPNIPSTPTTLTLLFLTANIFMRDLNVYCQKFNGQAVVIVHSYVEVHMYLLHEFCTKPKLIHRRGTYVPSTRVLYEA